MKEMFKITASLTGVCLAAALILGAVYTQTELARKEIEKSQNEHIIEGLLGFGHGKKAPADFKVFPVYRYVLKDPKAGLMLGYVVPVKEGKAELVTIDLSGKPVKAYPVKGSTTELGERDTRDAAVKATLPKGFTATYAAVFYVSDLGGKRHGYVLPGITQGFKTFIKLMVSLNKDFTVTGVAITESEEDPGLGANIKKDYFKNQFIGKTMQILKTLKVIKEPIPKDYLEVLVPAKAKMAHLTPEKIKEIEKKHVKDNIYALTGATISSRAMTRGVKNTVRKFVYRFNILEKAIEHEKIQVAF
jgi:electron transport complex protein RnfG